MLLADGLALVSGLTEGPEMKTRNLERSIKVKIVEDKFQENQNDDWWWKCSKVRVEGMFP